jgi:hypothetical protein
VNGNVIMGRDNGGDAHAALLFMYTLLQTFLIVNVKEC